MTRRSRVSISTAEVVTKRFILNFFTIYYVAICNEAISHEFFGNVCRHGGHLHTILMKNYTYLDRLSFSEQKQIKSSMVDVHLYSMIISEERLCISHRSFLQQMSCLALMM